MIFRIMALVMGAIIAMFALSVDLEHAVYAALIPAAAAAGMLILASN